MYYCSNGIINFDECSSIKYHKLYLSRLSIENQVVYVTEPKLIFNYILSIFFVYYLERLFSAHEGSSIRK